MLYKKICKNKFREPNTERNNRELLKPSQRQLQM